MKSVLLTIALGGSLAACSHGPPPPQLDFATVGYVLTLPDGMQKALDATAPGFRHVLPNVFRSDVSQGAILTSGTMQALFAITGDFDGDGSMDLIVEGSEPSDSALHVIAIMNGAKPHAFEVMSVPVYDADAVGVYITKPTGGRTGAFEVINYPDASTLYTYKSGGFVGTKIDN